MKIKEKIKQILVFKGDPHFLGLSLGVGVAIGILPGTGAIVAGIAAPILRLNLPLMVSGALLSNPITSPLVYGASYWIGCRLFHITFLEQFKWAQIFLTTLAGNIVLALAMGVASYLLLTVFLIVMRWLIRQRRRLRRTQENKNVTGS
jgi:uncharacterized protein (DUF2062 family)